MASHKEKGNDAFKAGDYATAVGHYASAMLAEPNNATYPLNRAAAYLKLDKYQDAERDCEKVLQLDSENIKGLFRRAQARAGVGKLTEARADLLKVIKIEPNNALARQELESIKARIAKVEGKKKAVPPRGPMWKPPSEPMVKKPSPTKSVAATSPPVKVSATTTLTPTPTEDGSSRLAKTTTPTRSSSDSQARGASVRKRIPIKIIDGEAPRGDKDAPSGITTSSIKGSRMIEELQSSPAEPAKAAPKGGTISPSPAPLQAPPAEFSAFLTEVSSQPVSETKTKAGSPSTKATNSISNDQSRIVRVGGGIWKKGGDNRTVLAERVLERAPPKPVASRNRSQGGDEVQRPVDMFNGTSTVAKSGKPLLSKPATLFELERGWKACEGVDDRWRLLMTIPVTEFVGIFKNSLDPPFLTSMLETFKVLLVNDQTLKQALGQYFNALQRVPRFDTLTLFLSPSEAQTLKDVRKLLEV